MKKKVITKIGSNELDTLVQEKLGYKKYEFAPVEECGNDSSHEFDVDGEIDKYDQEDLDKWAAGKFVHYSNHTVLNKLCKDGHIKKGTYLVGVCW